MLTRAQKNAIINLDRAQERMLRAFGYRQKRLLTGRTRAARHWVPPVSEPGFTGRVFQDRVQAFKHLMKTQFVA